MNQRLKIDTLTVSDLVNRMIGSDGGLEAHKNEIHEKKTRLATNHVQIMSGTSGISNYHMLFTNSFQ